MQCLFTRNEQGVNASEGLLHDFEVNIVDFGVQDNQSDFCFSMSLRVEKLKTD